MNAREYKIGIIEKKSDFKRVKVTTAQAAADYARQFYFDDINIYESMFIMLLNRQGQIIGWAKISQGGTAGTVVDNKIIAKIALDVLASSVIMVHNHPSGSLNFSNQDINASSKLKSALALLDITLLDSIVLAENGYKSMNEEGTI